VPFPDPATYDFPEWVVIGNYAYYGRDVISFGDPLTLENVREAYQKGIFPWYMKGVPLPWHCPERRAILQFDDLHIPKSLERERRKTELSFTIDYSFHRVIKECAQVPRTHEKGTWITPDFIRVYTELHREGMAHSVEAWSEKGKLVGGIYGVDAGGVFCGESMFYKEPNASKLALLFLIDHLRSRGSTWLDAQVMTPHIRAFGAKEIDRSEFIKKLRSTQRLELRLFEPAPRSQNSTGSA
jgi:leucyl/phenylalanyl-tRNA--protein transferase